MPDNVINKVVFEGRTLIDLTDTTATADKIKTGYGAYGADGVWMDGTANTGGDNGDVYQDEEGYLVLAPGAGTNVSVTPLSVTENGTYSAPTGVAYSPVTVDVEQGETIPHYTLQFNSQTYELEYATCDMTYYEILDLIPLGMLSYPCEVYEYDGASVPLGASIRYDSQTEELIVKVLNADCVPAYIIYHTSDSITAEDWDHNDETDLSVSGNIVTASAGWYDSNVSTSVPSAAQATPTIAFSSNGLITATAVQTSGYVSAGTKTSTFSLATKSAADMTVNGSYVTAPSGYYSEAFSKAVSEGSIKLKALDYGGRGSIAFDMSTGIISYDNVFSGTYNVSSFLSGYINAAPSNANYYFRVSASTQLAVFSASTWTPSSTNQTISSYQWLTGSQTILGDSNLVSANIKSGVSIFGVNGTYEGAEIPSSITILPETTFTITSIEDSYYYFDNFVPTALQPLEIIINNVSYTGKKLSYDIVGNDKEIYIYSNDLQQDLVGILYNVNVNNTYIRMFETGQYTIEILYHVNSVTNYDKETLISNKTVNVYFNESGIGEIYADLSNTPSKDYVWYEITLDGESGIIYVNDIDHILINNYELYNFEIGAYIRCKIKSNDKRYNYYDVNITVKGIDSIADRISILQGGGYLEYPKDDTAYNVETFKNIYIKTAAPSIIKRTISSYYADMPNAQIGSYAFARCTNLRSVHITGAHGIESYAFYYCSYLSDVSIPDCTNISPYAFDNAFSYGVTVSFPSVINVQPSAFYAARLGAINLPSCTYIGSYAFQTCYSLYEVSAPICSSIGTSAFYACSSLTNVNISSCVYIGTSAFRSCANLKDLSLPELTGIGTYAFYGCYSISNVYFPKLSSVTMYAFTYCSSLANVYLPSCTSIASYAFMYCRNLTTISLPECLSFQAPSTFVYCNALTNISVPKLRACIGLSYCYNLGQISLPDCSIIQNNAFYNCSKLLSIYLFSTSMTVLSSTNAFGSTPISEYTTYTDGVYGSVFVPASLYNSYISATNWIVYSSRIVSLTDAQIAALSS